MRFERHNGNWIVCGYIFPNSEIKIGQRWQSSSNSIVTIENNDGDFIYYFWFEDGVKKSHDKDTFSFQCRYCLILDNPLENVVCYSPISKEFDIFKNPSNCFKMNYQTISKNWANGKDRISDCYIYIEQISDGDKIIEQWNDVSKGFTIFQLLSFGE